MRPDDDKRDLPYGNFVFDVDSHLENPKKNPSKNDGKDHGRDGVLKKKQKLKNPCDVHYRLSADGYEYLMRTVHEMPGIKSLSHAERKLWLTRGWELRLERLRIQQRAQEIPDEKFVHSSRWKK